MTNFNEFGLLPPLIEALERMLITTPTAIQKETIPLALKGQDILASAQTGTGKTIAYLIPLITKLSLSPKSSALILAPTRELAMQIHAALIQMLGGAPSPFKTALLIGGAPIFKQLLDLKKRPRLIVGTPGRITDHLIRGSLSLSTTEFLIIDEADRMLDMGFGVQLDQIAEYLPSQRQTLMFSATFSKNIERLSKKYLNNPQRICIDPQQQVAPKIKQEVLHMHVKEKLTQLLQQLNQREGSIIVFVKTKRRAESLAQELQEYGHNSAAMHGDLPQRKRENVIRSFRTNKSRIMVATDVAARGLDIPHVMHVINFDLPECPEDYVHRIGRTGRAEAEGFALSFISPDETYKWKEISKLINPDEKFRDTEKTSPPKVFKEKRPWGAGKKPPYRAHSKSRKGPPSKFPFKRRTETTNAPH